MESPWENRQKTRSETGEAERRIGKMGEGRVQPVWWVLEKREAMPTVGQLMGYQAA
jgi:hypothetical protein